jgi:hypothetical protein
VWARSPAGDARQSAAGRPELPSCKPDSAPPGEHGRLELGPGALSLRRERAVADSRAPATGNGTCPHAEPPKGIANVAENHQRPAKRYVKRHECRKRTDHPTADMGAAAKVGHVKADCARRAEHDAPTNRNKTNANHREQPSAREIAERRQRRERDEQRSSDKENRQYAQDQDLESEKTDGEHQRHQTEQAEKRAPDTEYRRAGEHDENSAIKALTHDGPRQHCVSECVYRGDAEPKREAVHHEPKHGAYHAK